MGPPVRRSITDIWMGKTIGAISPVSPAALRFGNPYQSSPSFRGDAKASNRNLEIPDMVLAHHSGMTANQLQGIS
jgi:hypothetical protein